MAVFVVEVEESVHSIVFFQDTKKRLSGDNLVKNPFTGTVKRVSDNLFAVDMKPIYPNFTLLTWPAIAVMYLFAGLTWWMLIPLLLGTLGLMWSKWFFFTFMKLGLKKAGYKGPARMLKNEEALRRCLFNGTDGSSAVPAGTKEN